MCGLQSIFTGLISSCFLWTQPASPVRQTLRLRMLQTLFSPCYAHLSAHVPRTQLLHQFTSLSYGKPSLHGCCSLTTPGRDHLSPLNPSNVFSPITHLASTAVPQWSTSISYLLYLLQGLRALRVRILNCTFSPSIVIKKIPFNP